MKKIAFFTIVCFALLAACKKTNTEVTNTERQNFISTEPSISLLFSNGNSSDLSNNRRRVVLHGATFTTDRFGNANSALYFKGWNNGDPDYIDFPTLYELDSTDEISISMWLKVDSTRPSGNTPFTLIPDDPYDRLNCHVNYSPYAAFWDNGDIYGSGRIYAARADSYEWDHYVFIKSKIHSKMELYINDSLYASSNSYDDIDNKHRTFRLGGGAGGLGMPAGDQYFAGWMDDIQIYSKALTAAEVDSIYNGITSN